jgi:hypothetical protein
MQRRDAGAGRNAARDTSREHADLTDALIGLEAALASPSYRRRSWWRGRVARELEILIEALASHRESSERPGGLYDEFQQHLGRTPALRRGLQEHAQIEEAEEQPRREAELLTRAIRRHQAREAELLLEAFSRDIGVGD